MPAFGVEPVPRDRGCQVALTKEEKREMSSLSESQHEVVSNMPFTWKMTAESLLHASNVLRERCDVETPGQLPSADTYLTPIELMLRGMAAECLLKAIWVHKGNKLSEAGTYIGIPSAPSHDLVKMAMSVGIKLNENELNLLMRLSHFTEYPGRYPTPARASKLELKESPSGGRGPATVWSPRSDNKAFEDFVARLNGLLP